MGRVAYARTYLTGTWTLPHQTPRSVGKALGRLEPTWVTGLERFAIGERVTAREVSNYDTIRDTVRAAAPDAQFDIELNTLDYRTPAQIRTMMSRLRAKFGNDGWSMDFWTPAWDKRPDVVRAAVAEAHEHGQWIGGNAFGWEGKPVVPPGSDFLEVADSNFKLDLEAVSRLAEQVPVLFHLRNNPGHPSSEGCVYIQRYTTAEREAYVRKRAAEQADTGFSFAYPVFFPTCQIKSGLAAFDSTRDGSMLDTIEGLMQRYN